MAYIKKTNVVSFREITDSIRKVQCPYCKTFLEPVPTHVTAMLCWKCNKEFRIEHDQDKICEFEARKIQKRLCDSKDDQNIHQS